MVILRVAEAGFYGGDLDKVRNARVDDVISVFNFMDFRGTYDSTMYEINRGESG